MSARGGDGAVREGEGGRGCVPTDEGGAGRGVTHLRAAVVELAVVFAVSEDDRARHAADGAADALRGKGSRAGVGGEGGRSDRSSASPPGTTVDVRIRGARGGGDPSRTDRRRTSGRGRVVAARAPSRLSRAWRTCRSRANPTRLRGRSARRAASASGINGSCALGVVGWSCHIGVAVIPRIARSRGAVGISRENFASCLVIPRRAAPMVPSPDALDGSVDRPPAFTYVLVPADDASPVQELTSACLGYAGDALPSLAAARFATAAAPSPGSSSAASDASTARVLAAAATGKAETFALVHPADTNGNRGVYLYVDEVGKLRGAPANARAADLAARCGLSSPPDADAPPLAFHGAVLVGAVRTDPDVRNASFEARELEPDAAWLLRAPAENAAYAVVMRDFVAAVASKRVTDAQAAEIRADAEGRARARASDDHRNPHRDADDAYASALVAESIANEEARTRTKAATKAAPEKGGDRRRPAELSSYLSGLVDARDAPVSAASGSVRGFGLVARRDVRRGEVLWCDRPSRACRRRTPARRRVRVVPPDGRSRRVLSRSRPARFQTRDAADAPASTSTRKHRRR